MERTLVRERLISGVLPCGPVQELFGGSGTGAICCCCDQIINPEQIEFEIHAGAVLMMHSHCMRIWYEEWSSSPR